MGESEIRFKEVENVDVDALWAKGAHVDAIDFLAENENIDKVRELPLDKVDATRLVLYMQSAAMITPNGKEAAKMLDLCYDLCVSHGDMVTALQISLLAGNYRERVYELFDLCKSPSAKVPPERQTKVLESDAWPESVRLTYDIGAKETEKLENESRLRRLMIVQMAYILSRHEILQIDEERLLGPEGFVIDDVMDSEGIKRILRREHISDLFQYLAAEIEVTEPRHPDEVFKTELEDPKKRVRAAVALDLQKAAQASAYVSGFLHAGFKSDAILLKEESQFINKTRGTGMTAATAALGLICLWNVEEGLAHIDKFQYSSEPNTRAGAMLAFGLNACNVANVCDPVLNLVGDALKASNAIERISAALALAYAHVGTARPEVAELLVPIVLDLETFGGLEVSSAAALALGMTFVGTADESMSEALIQTLIERVEAKALDTIMACNLSIALGLIFLEQKSKCEPVLEGLSAVDHPIADFTKIILEGCAYAGTGDLVKVQEMIQKCIKKMEELQEEEKSEDEKEEDKESPYARVKEDFCTSVPATTMIAISLIMLRDEIGNDMTFRLMNHILQFDGLFVRRAVPIALGIQATSNPRPHVVDLLSKLSHDPDADVALHAIVGLGMVSAGTNNARVAQILRQLASYYSAEANAIFLIKLSQGLLYCGKGLTSLSPLHSDRKLIDRNALAGLLSFAVQAIFTKDTLCTEQYHLNVYHLVPAISPRWLVTLDEDLRPVAVQVRVGQALDVAGMAGQPKKITGFRTHQTPVLLAYDERAQMGVDDWHPLSPVLEGIVIVRKLAGKDRVSAAKALD